MAFSRKVPFTQLYTNSTTLSIGAIKVQDQFSIDFLLLISDNNDIRIKLDWTNKNSHFTYLFSYPLISILNNNPKFPS